ncbi:nonsense-mediated mRNA decay protein NMD3 family protein [Aliivibrio sp. EL58]|uniref:nonsense-mediated mRNA decay protein NMD3 family protein n=1 Tax=Aliivibrio sp. EL58 TaxID=2107582 RepID=UPI000EFAC1D5|nr:nonsense-mediated mRNA decay protein NMD3 family protein [Aliivibrio sp. EL58]
MNELTECPKCLSDELLISDNENTVICSDCGVIKKDGAWLIAKELKTEVTA